MHITIVNNKIYPQIKNDDATLTLSTLDHAKSHTKCEKFASICQCVVSFYFMRHLAYLMQTPGISGSLLSISILYLMIK